MRILSCDPGEHLGFVIAFFDPKSKEMVLSSTGTVSGFDAGIHFIAQRMGEELDLIICESYIVNPRVYGYDHQGDKGFTLRQIGALELLAKLGSIEFVFQSPTVKPVGYGFLGKKYKRGKQEMHGFDSLAHLVYYLVSKRSMQPLA